jgi:pilus assembly protein CpaC
VAFVPFGVQLAFTPYITDRDRIRLDIAAAVSTRDNSGGTAIGGSNVPGLNTRNFSTTVELREGQTLAVAGLIQNNLGATSDRVPGLGDLPIIGNLWKFDRITTGEQELVVLITPELVHPMEPKEIPPLPGSDLFEPGDLEFYLLGRLESRRSYDYRSTVMSDIHRMARYRHCENLYIIGPHGHAEPPPPPKR